MSLWVSIADADTYFTTRLAAAVTTWSDLADGDKTTYLTTAQATLDNIGRWTLVEPDSGEEQDQPVQDAICEQAFFMAAHPEWEDRMGLEAQGVMTTWVVLERRDYVGVAVVATAVNLLRDYRKYGQGFKSNYPA